MGYQHATDFAERFYLSNYPYPVYAHSVTIYLKSRADIVIIAMFCGHRQVRAQEVITTYQGHFMFASILPDDTAHPYYLKPMFGVKMLGSSRLTAAWVAGKSDEKFF